MVLATAWLILRYLVRIQETQNTGDRGVDNKNTGDRGDTEVDKDIADTVVDTDRQSEVSTLHEEIQSVRAVLEMKVEEVRRLRQELDRREGWREDKGTMTEEIQTYRDIDW